MSITKPWFRDSGQPFESDDPFFFDESEFAWRADIEPHWQTIRDEVFDVIARDAEPFIPYPQDGGKTVGQNKWRTLALMFWGYKIEENCKLFPKTWELVKDIPGVTAVSFNLLEENTTIRPHYGDTNAIARCHMGLDVPAALPRCGFRVGDKTKSWEHGKFFMFNDAYEHTAWNNTGKKRLVMVIDVMRDQYTQYTDSTASRVLATIKAEVLKEHTPLANSIKRSWVFNKLLFSLFYMVNWIQILTGTNKLKMS